MSENPFGAKYWGNQRLTRGYVGNERISYWADGTPKWVGSSRVGHWSDGTPKWVGGDRFSSSGGQSYIGDRKIQY